MATERGREYSRRIIMWWVRHVERRPYVTLLLAALLTVAALLYSASHFRINVDMSGMISENLRFRRIQEDYSKAFPNLSDTIVLVIDGESPELAWSARRKLADRMRQDTHVFKNVYEPGGGAFFEKNGLLFLSEDELLDFSDSMAAAQPLLALLSRDLSLKGLFSMLQQALEQPGDEAIKNKRIGLLFDRMGRAFESVGRGVPYQFSWQELMLGEKEAKGQRRQYVIAQPSGDITRLSSSATCLDAVKKIIRELGFSDNSGVRVRITGDIPLNEENMAEVRNSIGAATVASLLLVAVILYIGLGRSGRLILAGLITLLIGLVLTSGFALFFIGSLNMISVTFAVLFIGLGIDYSIQYTLRHRELIACGTALPDSLTTTAGGVGRGLLLSCVTTAIGFYSFIPTAYSGVAELGLISGTGMFISFFANLTVLPAILTIFPFKARNSCKTGTAPQTIMRVPYRYPRSIAIVALIVGGGAAAFLPRVYFDYDPMNLYSPSSEAVTTIKELFKEPLASPWTASVLVRGAEETRALEKKLTSLREVKMAISLFDFVPRDQGPKLDILSNVALFMPPMPEHLSIRKATYAEDMKALEGFEKALKKSLRSSAGDRAVREKLYMEIERIRPLLKTPAEGRRAFASLEEDLLSNLPVLLERLQRSLQASRVRISDLPAELVHQYRSPVDGSYRIQVFPSEDVSDRKALGRFVSAVRKVAPDATDSPVTIYESGMAVITSFKEATSYALIAIVIFLLFELRSIVTTLLVLVPLLLAMTVTGAASVLLGIPLNFANVIVVPLLLGVGVHTGIIFILRYQTEPPENGNMLTTSTARSILLSCLTTMISTGSLSFSGHRGIASIGILMTICFGLLIVSTLILLPALLQLSEKGLKRKI